MSLVACSGSKSTNEADETEAGTELSEESEDFSEDDGDEIADETFDEESSDDAISDEETADASEPAEDEVVEAEPQAVDQSSEMAMTDSAPVQIDTNGEDGWYTVKKSETLMIIAFKIYGDYEKWRELARWNANQLGSGHGITIGMKLKYETPNQKFVWNPEGNPYLIRMGDTLGTISKDTYGTTGYWKNIWQNNKPLIKNPNRIFAGFTIYTPVLEGREVANDNI